jgi:ribosomal protein S18 acetylase RimI-like enzyme
MRRMIRVATPSDLESVVAIHVAAFRAGNSPHLATELAGHMNAERSAAGWRSLIESASPGRTVLVAPDGDGIAGVTAAGPSREPHDGGAELYALYVDPERFGAGHGAALDAAAREHLGTHGFTAASLWVLEGNGRARRFYERRGWQVDGERRQHLGAMTVRYSVPL